MPDKYQELKNAAVWLDGNWEAMLDGGVVFWPDGDAACTCYDWHGDPEQLIDAVDIAKYIALASPKAIQALLAERDALRAALAGYIDAVTLANLAMQDGINVHGALAGLAACEEQARAALSL